MLGIFQLKQLELKLEKREKKVVRHTDLKRRGEVDVPPHRVNVTLLGVLGKAGDFPASPVRHLFSSCLLLFYSSTLLLFCSAISTLYNHPIFTSSVLLPETEEALAT
jgi:hypothetical protein